MAEPLKNMYTEALIGKLADTLRGSWKSFDKKSFIAFVFDKEWKNKELKQRMRHITVSMHRHLPLPYREQLEVLHKAAPQFAGFAGLVFPDFVETYGIEDPDHSIPALEHFTKYSSSEFAVRPFIMRYEKRMIKQHIAWTKHPDHHVRRLASEGIRPRLPWGMALQSFKKDPSPLLPVLELLKKDVSEYVRRSVANNLNDISKDHPAVVLSIINSWKGNGEGTDRIIRHAGRGLLKKGHTEALQSFGLNHKIRVKAQELTVSRKKLKIGDDFEFSFSISLEEKKPHDLRLEYRIYFVKSSGKAGPKIFQIGTYPLKAGESLSMRRKHKFADLTTRKHYSGEHRIALVANGKEVAEETFMLL